MYAELPTEVKMEEGSLEPRLHSVAGVSSASWRAR